MSRDAVTASLKEERLAREQDILCKGTMNANAFGKVRAGNGSLDKKEGQNCTSGRLRCHQHVLRTVMEIACARCGPSDYAVCDQYML